MMRVVYRNPDQIERMWLKLQMARRGGGSLQ